MIEAPASKSFTAGRALPKRDRISPLVWMNLVCLDAPLVALSWHLLFARSFGIRLSGGTTAALFLTAWLIYLADRLGDSLSLDRQMPKSLRQSFCLQHALGWMIGVVLIALADGVVVLTQLDLQAKIAGGAVGLLAFVYLLINRFRPGAWRVVPLKEISIGSIFAAGTMVGLLRGLTSAAVPIWLLFAVLCSLNCISIAVWERELDRAQERISVATVFPRVSRVLLPALLIIAVVNLASLSALHLCLATSALSLAAVHLWQARISFDVRTAFADIVLMTPLVALFFQ